MLGGLLEVAAARVVPVLLEDHVDRALLHHALLRAHAHALQHLRQREALKDRPLLLRGVVRDVDHREAAHKRRADAVLIIRRRDRIDARGRDTALDIVVGIADIVEQRQQRIRRIAA